MRTLIKMICILALIILTSIFGLFVFMKVSGRLDPLDKDMMENDWRQYRLYGNWNGLDGSSMLIDEEKIVLTTSDATYTIPYDIEGVGTAKIKLKANNPYEYFIYTTEQTGETVLSGFVQNDNEMYEISNEFLFEQEVDPNFKSSYRDNYEKSLFMSETYVLDDAMECISYLGHTRTDMKIENMYIDDTAVSFYTINVESTFMDTPVTGEMYSQVEPNVDMDSLLINEVMLYAHELTYDDVYSYFKERYDLIEEGEEPYAISSGGAIQWSTFDLKSCTARITQGSESDYVMIQISLNS